MQVTWSDREIELGLVGRVGESNTRTITVDCAKIMDAYPAARIACVLSRPDGATYTAPLAEDGKKRTVTLSAVDLAMPGTLRLELRALEGGAVLKSAILRGTVADSIRGEGDAPGQPVRDVLDRVDDTLKAAEATRKELETALGGVQGAVDAATEAAAAAEETDAQIQAAEQGRVEAEQERVKAEQERVKAEKKREKATAAAVKSITDTVDDVQNKLESGAFTGAPGAPGAPGKDGKDAPQIDDTTVSDAAPWSSQHIVDMLCPPLEESGNPVACYPVAGSTLGVTARWEPTQEGDGTPSPDNIRPIHGRTQVKVERCGENLLNLPLQSTVNGIKITTEADGRYHLQGTIKRNGFMYTIGKVTLPSGTYAVKKSSIKSPVTDAAIVITLRTENKDGSNTSWIETTINSNRNIGSLHKPTTIRIAIYGSNANIRQGDVIDAYIEFMLVPGTTAPATYSPYTGSTTTLTLPSSIYGGEVGADGDGQETWGYIESYAGEPLPAEWICDRAVYAEGATPPTGAQVAYKLATPIPFSATGGGTIKALPGTNTILTDADTLTVTGRADPIHIIQQLQAASAASAQALADVERAVTDI
nr:MAG TPA: nucleoid-associated protein [Caudoviricetes sp.]